MSADQLAVAEPTVIILKWNYQTHDSTTQTIALMQMTIEDTVQVIGSMENKGLEELHACSNHIKDFNSVTSSDLGRCQQYVTSRLKPRTR